MRSLISSLAGFCALSLSSLVLQARDFTVAVYNVENLFDIDGKAVYDEYQSSAYGAPQLCTKVTNIAKVIARLNADVVMLQEVEIDRSPSSRSPSEVLRVHEKTPLAELLRGKVSEDLSDLPAEAWLYKALEEQGVRGYQVVIGADQPVSHEDGNTRAIKCVILTRFPVKEVRNHPIVNARNILELRLDVEGHELYVFDNHWKSGAGNADTESVRVQNATVLRKRLDEILAKEPRADIILGGDFNSQYNQVQRYPAMGKTAIDAVLGSQGDELALRGGKADLYNLWYELPEENRGSDVFEGEWGTLIQLIISRGLYDQRGIQYVDGSFTVAKFPGLNTNANGTPMRWSNKGPAGSGFSDHFPVLAQFRTVDGAGSDGWMELKNPSKGQGSGKPVAVAGFSKKADLDPKKEAVQPPADAKLRDGSWTGKIMLVEGSLQDGQRASIEFRGEVYEIYSPLPSVREKVRDLLKSGGKVKFYGELGQYRGRWQFVIRADSWIQ